MCVCVCVQVSELLKSALPSMTSSCPILSPSTATQRSALHALLAILSYPTRFKMTRTYDVGSCVSIPLLSSLFSIVKDASSPNRSAALMCVNEVVDRNCWPSDQAKDFILELCSHVNSVVQAHTDLLKAHAGGSDDADDENGFESQLVNFLANFSERHLRYASSQPGVFR